MTTFPVNGPCEILNEISSPVFHDTLRAIHKSGWIQRPQENDWAALFECQLVWWKTFGFHPGTAASVQPKPEIYAWHDNISE